ncbi:MAG: DUF3570 domain-containing protein [Pseudomonadales bacterium]|nr:DUF3570 domain-containing protein [Pseudomonadales bacterium]MCP5185237.1 DUF3570 domain-containing protein [Pseudomonadales bacterium]
MQLMRRAGVRLLLLLTAMLPGMPGWAAVLPEDRADVMYHGYDGGGLQVNGPSVLVRKAYKDKVSVWANYYADMISSASIDVVTTASKYSEKRDEASVGVDYLRGKTFMGMSYTSSEESDYSAQSFRLGVSQDFFGDLTTLGLTYARGRDEIRRNGDDTFRRNADRQNFRVDLTQVITKDMLVAIGYEGITDEGYLNNPYRQVRFLDPNDARGYAYEAEIYPSTKTSSAVAIRSLYYLPWRASVRGEYRYYSDSWGVSAWNLEVGYVHPFDNGFTVEGRYRYYTQDAADFYSDLFPYQSAQNFLARDKELASFTNHVVGAGASYRFDVRWLPFIKRSEINLFVDWMKFDYDDFRDVRVGGVTPGDEPLYGFESLVFRAFLSVWF